MNKKNKHNSKHPFVWNVLVPNIFLSILTHLQWSTPNFQGTGVQHTWRPNNLGLEHSEKLPNQFGGHLKSSNIPLRKEGHYNADSLRIRGISRLLIAIRPLSTFKEQLYKPSHSYGLMTFFLAGGGGGCPHRRASPYTLQLLGTGKKKKKKKT
jgi:hypothetical protein